MLWAEMPQGWNECSSRRSTPVVASLLDGLQFSTQVLDGFDRAEIENSASISFPFSVIESKHCGGGSQIADGFDVFHIATWNGFKPNGDAHQGLELIAVAVARERFGIFEFDIFPE